jgi:biotin carboxyl carrier protein
LTIEWRPDLPQTPQPAREEDLKKSGLSMRTRILFFAIAWFIVLMPFLFWQSTWFGRALSDEQVTEYLRDEEKPRHIQHALVQIAGRMERQDPAVRQWYEEVAQLRAHPVDEIRNTAAWVMGQDTDYEPFREALREMLADPSPQVRSNAALALVRFGDAGGREQIAAMLHPATVLAPRAGRVAAVARAGEPVRAGTLLVQLESAGEALEVRSPLTGRVASIQVAAGAHVEAGRELAVVDPGAEQVWEALRALYLIGQMEDLPAVRPYARGRANLPERVRQQAELTEKAILKRAAE